MRDDRVGAAQDVAGGAVVLLQLHQLRARKMTGEILDVLHPRAPPAVDGLVVVAHHEEVVPVAREQQQPGVLDGVGVLELVHQHVLEPLAVVLQHVGPVAPQFMGAQQQLGEIHAARAFAGGLVGGVDADHLAPPKVAAVFEVLGAAPLVLLFVDEPLRLARRPLGIVQVELADHPLHQAELIVAVEDLEALWQVGLLPVGTQQAVGQAVEGAHPHAAHGIAEQLLDARAHLPRRLVGEGDREDAPGRDPLHLDQPGDAVHQHPGLAGAGAGEHQGGAGWRGDRLALGCVEAIEYCGYIHFYIVTRGRPVPGPNSGSFAARPPLLPLPAMESEAKAGSPR